jgi:hypothetical protein
MSIDLGCTADGIERAIAAGGVVLERYHRPGFTGGPAVRVSGSSATAAALAGDELELDDEDELALLAEGGSTLEPGGPAGRGGETAGGGSSSGCTGSQFSQARAIAAITALQDAQNREDAAEVLQRADLPLSVFFPQIQPTGQRCTEACPTRRHVAAAAGRNSDDFAGCVE